jgi:hypothetical protein
LRCPSMGRQEEQKGENCKLLPFHGISYRKTPFRRPEATLHTCINRAIMRQVSWHDRGNKQPRA